MRDVHGEDSARKRLARLNWLIPRLAKLALFDSLRQHEDGSLRPAETPERQHALAELMRLSTERQELEDDLLRAADWPPVESIEGLIALGDMSGMSLTERGRATHADIVERALNVSTGRRIEELQRARFRAEAENAVRRAEQPGECQHSDDFRTVVWYGERHTFSAMQAACVRILWGAWERGGSGLGQATILEGADSCSQRLDDIFRAGKLRHPAWGVMIVRIRRGVFGLAKPKS